MVAATGFGSMRVSGFDRAAGFEGLTTFAGFGLVAALGSADLARAAGLTAFAVGVFFFVGFFVAMLPLDSAIPAQIDGRKTLAYPNPHGTNTPFDVPAGRSHACPSARRIKPAPPGSPRV
ncbi:MAG: hypothetical protein HRU71_05755 [Planctomycetia bacterium]|nr:MAG: hypothetical protein HRU71_05755 [Planctomycetia bacterium]